MPKLENKKNYRKYISLLAAGICFVLAIIRMIYGLFLSHGAAPWYDYFIEMLFLSFIGVMLIRLSKTYK